MIRLFFGSLAFVLVLLAPLSTDLSFYVISNSRCEPCEVQVRSLRELYPNNTFVKYDVGESSNLNRFSAILREFEERYLPLPLIGVLVNGSLKLIVSGGFSREALKSAIANVTVGVNVYIDDGRGELVFVANIVDGGTIIRLQKLFTEKEVRPPFRSLESLILPVAFAAIVDAINPCMIAVYLVFMTFVLHSADRQTALRTGISFTVAVFAAHFVTGIGLSHVVGLIPNLKILFLGLAIFLGSLRIVEFFGHERSHLPGALAQRISRRIEKASNPRAGFAAGVVTTMFLLTCSSAPYFLALSLLSEAVSMLGGAILLLIYNTIMLAPLILITACIHILGVQTMSLKLWFSERRRWINLLMGIELILLGIFMLFV